MRKYIDILNEAQRIVFGDVTVWKNPSRNDLRSLLARSKEHELRGFLMGDLYVWDAYDAVHGDLEEVMEAQGAVKLVLYPDSVEVSYRDDPDSDGDEGDDGEYVGNHPTIVRAYGRTPEVVAGVF